MNSCLFRIILRFAWVRVALVRWLNRPPISGVRLGEWLGTWGARWNSLLPTFKDRREVVPLNTDFRSWTRGPTFLLAREGFWFIGWTLNQLFNNGSVGLKEQDVISRVKRYFDPTKIYNNLWTCEELIYWSWLYQMNKNISIVRGVQLLGYSGVA